MRYKNNVLDKLTQLESTVTKIQFQVNRGMGQDQILDSVENLKEQIEKTREMVSLEPDEFAQLIMALGKRYNNAMLAIEFNKDGNWVNTEVRNSNYPNIYVRTEVDRITKEPTQSYGWLTNKKNRDFMLGEAKKHFNSTDMINCRPLLEEILTFVRDKRGKPQASVGSHDDVVISWAIAIAILQGTTEKIELVKPMGVLDVIFQQN
jgi:phage terminase large subunit